MFKTVSLKIEHDEFHPNEISLKLGDDLEVYIDGFIPKDQKYVLLCSQFTALVLSPGEKFRHRFSVPGEFLIECEDQM